MHTVPYELIDEPKRNVRWFVSGHPKDAVNGYLDKKLALQRTQPIAELVAGGYWSRPVARELSFDRVWIGRATADRFRNKGLTQPVYALSRSLEELSLLGICDESVSELIAAACQPPKRVEMNWMSIGECLHKILVIDPKSAPCIPITLLETSNANMRFLIRHGITTIARLLLSNPGRLRQLRGLGPARFSQIIEALRRFDCDPFRIKRGQHKHPRAQFAEWFNLRNHRYSESTLNLAKTVLVTDCLSPRSTLAYLESTDLLHSNEMELLAQGVSPGSLMKAMSVLVEER